MIHQLLHHRGTVTLGSKKLPSELNSVPR